MKDNREKAVLDSLKWYTSPINPTTRKGGGMSRKGALSLVRSETTIGPKAWKRVLKTLGWR